MGYPWDKLCPTVVFAICKWVLVSKKKFPIESEWNIEIWSECAKQGQHFNNWPLNCKLIVTTASPMSASINGFKKLLTATRAASPIASIRRAESWKKPFSFQSQFHQRRPSLTGQNRKVAAAKFLQLPRSWPCQWRSFAAWLDVQCCALMRTPGLSVTHWRNPRPQGF